ncbi:DUF692 domain-containing protein [Streptomyces sp. SPB074]|uniref:DUF692 domain-containing protein n=1 Tax=Streptomyces sp. (strain SPB074) TaxID=465543 RepID=UPI0001D1E249|nr:DUF692 domain-containing protein [Streptomyces sp. SPB074]EFG64462.1 AP endonuclease, family 2 [Streptomyces sp. SPB074]
MTAVEAGAARAGVRLGTGIGWRPEIAEAVERMDVDWVEAVAENICPGHVPESLLRLRARNVTVVPHGVGLGLGGAGRPDPGRLAALAERAETLGAPLVTEHIAFVRAGALEAGHLLPVPRTRAGLAVLCENVRIAQDALPVPLAVENIAALFTWPGEELTEGQFLYELVERTGVRLLIDVANLHTNQVNSGEDAVRALDELPLEALAYVHVAGGVLREGVWHDTHAHPVPPQVLALLGELCARAEPPGVLLERDDDFPAAAELEGELRAIRETVRGSAAPARGSGVGPRSGAALVAEETRERLAAEQSALLAALVAGGPAPRGFDAERLAVQASALAGKRGQIVGKVAPELPRLLGADYRAAFRAYATSRPPAGGYRRDALDFAAHVLEHPGPSLSTRTLRALARWHADRSGPVPPRGGLRPVLRRRAA